jgi:GAF domain-containing protein
MRPSEPPAAVFERIALDSGPSLRHALFTVTWFDAAAMQVRRVYSSNPLAYPVGGRKPKRDTAWGRQVLIECRPLVCEGDAAIARMFDDHATILGLGLHSAINAPVLNEGQCVGVLNFLMASDRATAQQVRAACDFARQPAVVAALAAMARDVPDAASAA